MSFQVFLRETAEIVASLEGTDVRYTALSHCWGPTPIIKTTKATKSEFEKEGISWEGLPKTFQEAILLTCELDIDYIWIDSLCKHFRKSRHAVDCTKFSCCDRHLTRRYGHRRMGL